MKKKEGVVFIFDPIRKKEIVQTPEEIVRQLTVQYLIEEKGYSQNRIAIEKMLLVNERRKRFDILVYDGGTLPFLLVECKAPNIPVDENVFHQIANYNLALKVQYLLVTNGVDAYCCKMNYEEHSYEFVNEVPSFPEVSS